MSTQGTNPSAKRSDTSRSSGARSGRSTQARRPANGQRSASGQRSANGQRSASGQRASGGQRPAGQRPRKKKSRVSPLLVTLIVALALVIVVFAGLGIYVMRYNNYDKILPNVYVAGIDVGGMTREEAKAAIEGALTETAQQSINVNLPDKTLTFTPRQDTVLINVDQAVEEAYAYGRANTSPFTIARAIKAAERRRNDIDITSAVEVDEQYIRQMIDQTAAEVDTSLVESQVKTEQDPRAITVTIGSPSRSIDKEKLFDLVSGAFASANYSDIDFDYDVSYPAMVQLDDLYKELTTEAKDAKYDPETGDISEGQVGYAPTVTLDKANEQLAMASAGDVLTFSFEKTEPEVTAEELEGLLFRDTLAEYGSIYAVNYGRTINLELACDAINGTVLQPGEVFSFNDTVGERTADKGYQEAIVYVSGRSESELGGGVCQVASTIYYCAMYADLEIVEREPHQFSVDYVPGGLDATVYWGSLDFRFRNSTDYPLKINAYLEGGCCWIELIGTNIDGKSVEIESVQTNVIPFNVITTADPNAVQTGYTGYTYQITRYVYDEYGDLIRTDSTEDLDRLSPALGTSSYEKRDKVVYGGDYDPYTPVTPYEPSTEPDPSVDPTPSESPTVEPDPPVVEPDPPVVDPNPPTVEPVDPVVVDPGAGIEVP